MIPTKIGFTRDSLIQYVFESLAEPGETRENIEASPNTQLLTRVIEADIFTDEMECAGVFTGSYPKNVIDFDTVMDLIGIPVSIDEYLAEKEASINIEED